MEPQKKELLTAMADWWAAYIKKPARGDDFNGGLDGFASILATYTKAVSTNRSPANDQMITVFKEALIESFSKTYDLCTTTQRDFTVSTDWAPEMELAEACHKAGISGSFFPSKTMMWVHPKDRTITARIGTRDQTIKVYPAAA